MIVFLYTAKVGYFSGFAAIRGSFGADICQFRAKKLQHDRRCIAIVLHI